MAGDLYALTAATAARLRQLLDRDAAGLDRAAPPRGLQNAELVRCVGRDEDNPGHWLGEVVWRTGSVWSAAGDGVVRLRSLSGGGFRTGRVYQATAGETLADGTPVFWADGGGKTALGKPCLVPVRDAYGNVVGIAGIGQRYELDDGSVKCEVGGYCEGEDCGEDDVPDDPPPPPPPPDEPEPPDPPPEEFMIWVQVEECPGFTPTGFPYTVTVADSTEGSQPVGSGGGVWFTGIPWGTDTAAVLSYAGSETVMFNVASMGCGGPSSFGFGLTATVNGQYCEHMSVEFALGGCVPQAPNDLDDVDAPPIDP